MGGRSLFLFLLTLFPGLGTCVLAQSDTLTVGIYQNPPFVISTGEGEFTGLSIELWENIARSANIPFRYELHSDFVSTVKKLEYREIDLTVNPMEVNDLRVERFDMTQPFAISSIGVAIPYLNRSSLGVFLRNIFSFAFLEIVLLLVFVIFVFGFFLWLAERRENKLQFRPGLLGLFDGLWWSAVTMTTVGYGDKAPKTNQGKAIAIIWMFTAVIIISSFTASIASTLTISSLQTDVKDAEDIRLVERVSTVGASAGEDYLRRENIPVHRTFPSPVLALRALAKKENDVLLYDKTVLQYYVNRFALEDKVNLLPLTLRENYQSFMLPKNHPDFDRINAGLLREIQRERWRDLQRKYGVRGQ